MLIFNSELFAGCRVFGENVGTVDYVVLCEESLFWRY